MTTTATDPSLLRFLLERLREDTDLLIRNTPVNGAIVHDLEFERRFLDRSGLAHRIRTEKAIVALAVGAMQDEQGAPLPLSDAFVGGPITELGSHVLKLLAARYGEHPDYDEAWLPDVTLPPMGDHGL